ncbi:urease accessory protein UreF [Neotabrizicola sp. sgz301269]|uniref:urease accessory protein UreF n=1 Tax=Neotabrizicola sp. sgz301269 TaxID=3276282 RepID=UPI00376FFF0B
MTALLALVQWLSPAFPTGAFAYSHGLERVIAAGDVTDAASFEEWLRNILHHGAGRQDAILLTHALAPDADHAALDALARALAPSAERLQEGAEQGAAFARMASALTKRALTPRMLPIAVGEAAAPLALPPGQVAQLYLQNFAGNLCTIATRHVPLGQTGGQAVLSRLLPEIELLGTWAATAFLDDLGSFALAADLAAFQHETQDVRIFRT